MSKTKRRKKHTRISSKEITLHIILARKFSKKNEKNYARIGHVRSVI